MFLANFKRKFIDIALLVVSLLVVTLLYMIYAEGVKRVLEIQFYSTEDSYNYLYSAILLYYQKEPFLEKIFIPRIVVLIKSIDGTLGFKEIFTGLNNVALFISFHYLFLMGYFFLKNININGIRRYIYSILITVVTFFTFFKSVITLAQPSIEGVVFMLNCQTILLNILRLNYKNNGLFNTLFIVAIFLNIGLFILANNLGYILLIIQIAFLLFTTYDKLLRSQVLRIVILGILSYLLLYIALPEVPYERFKDAKAYLIFSSVIHHPFEWGLKGELFTTLYGAFLSLPYLLLFLVGLIHVLLFVYKYIRYQWGKPSGLQVGTLQSIYLYIAMYFVLMLVSLLVLPKTNSTLRYFIKLYPVMALYIVLGLNSLLRWFPRKLGSFIALLCIFLSFTYLNTNLYIDHQIANWNKVSRYGSRERIGYILADRTDTNSKVLMPYWPSILYGYYNNGNSIPNFRSIYFYEDYVYNGSNIHNLVIQEDIEFFLFDKVFQDYHKSTDQILYYFTPSYLSLTPVYVEKENALTLYKIVVHKRPIQYQIDYSSEESCIQDVTVNMSDYLEDGKVLDNLILTMNEPVQAVSEEDMLNLEINGRVRVYNYSKTPTFLRAWEQYSVILKNGVDIIDGVDRNILQISTQDSKTCIKYLTFNFLEGE